MPYFTLMWWWHLPFLHFNVHFRCGRTRDGGRTRANAAELKTKSACEHTHRNGYPNGKSKAFTIKCLMRTRRRRRTQLTIDLNTHFIFFTKLLSLHCDEIFIRRKKKGMIVVVVAVVAHHHRINNLYFCSFVFFSSDSIDCMCARTAHPFFVL